MAVSLQRALRLHNSKHALAVVPKRPRTRRPSSVRVCAGVKLYSNPRSRGAIIEWYAKEIGAPVDIVTLDMQNKEHKKDAYLQVNPFGKVPALSNDGFNLFESGALLLYLAELSGKTPTAEARARAAQWVLFANTTLSNAFFFEKFRDVQVPAVLSVLEELLAKQPYIEGDEFSLADVAVGSTLLYIPRFLPEIDFSKWTNVVAYMDRLASRPACPIGPGK